MSIACELPQHLTIINTLYFYGKFNFGFLLQSVLKLNIKKKTCTDYVLITPKKLLLGGNVTRTIMFAAVTYYDLYD